MWNCPTCREMFPFHDICDDEFHFIDADIDITMELLEMKEKVSVFDYDVFNFSQYKKSVLEKNVEPDDKAYDKFMEVFTTLYNQCCPLKRYL